MLALGLAACSSSKSKTGSASGSSATASAGFADCAKNPNTCNSGTTKQGGTFTYTLEKKIAGWNIINADSNIFEFQEVVDGVLPTAFITNPDFSVTLNKDLLASADSTTTGGVQTIVYKIQPSAVWSDGQPINADDFTYAWKTQNGTDCPKCTAASNSGFNVIKSVTGSDAGKTVTVVMTTPYSDWKAMFGPLYPAHIASEHGDLAASFAWLDANQPTYSGGPYTITGYTKDTSITETPNPKWYGAVKPSLDKLVFRIITDQTQEVPALQNNEVQAIYPQPNADIVSAVKAFSSSGVDSALANGLQWEHLDFNESNPILSDVKLRTAIFTAVSRNDVISKTIGQFEPDAKPLNNHMFVPGQAGYADNVTASGQGSGNTDKAKSILTAAGYTGVGSSLKTPGGKGVSIRCSFTVGNTLRQQTCELIQSELKALGITVTPTPIQSLGGTLASGDFDLILYATVDTPFVFSGAEQEWVSTSASNYGKWSSAQADTLLNQAATETNDTTARAELNKADVILTGNAYVLPLFQKPVFLAVYKNMINVRPNATNVGPPYNVQAWGAKAS